MTYLVQHLLQLSSWQGVGCIFLHSLGILWGDVWGLNTLEGPRFQAGHCHCWADCHSAILKSQLPHHKDRRNTSSPAYLLGSRGTKQVEELSKLMQGSIAGFLSGVGNMSVRGGKRFQRPWSSPQICWGSQPSGQHGVVIRLAEHLHRRGVAWLSHIRERGGEDCWRGQGRPFHGQWQSPHSSASFSQDRVWPPQGKMFDGVPFHSRSGPNATDGSGGWRSWALPLSPVWGGPRPWNVSGPSRWVQAVGWVGPDWKGKDPSTMENVLVLPPLLVFLSACKLGAILSPRTQR